MQQPNQSRIGNSNFISGVNLSVPKTELMSQHDPLPDASQRVNPPVLVPPEPFLGVVVHAHLAWHRWIHRKEC